MTLTINGGIISGAGRIVGNPDPPEPILITPTTEWGWNADLTEEQWTAHLAASEWVTLTGCTAQQAAAAYYVESGHLRYDASRSIAAGASVDFTSGLRFSPRFHFSLEGQFLSRRNRVAAGGYFDIRIPHLVDGVQTNWPTLTTDMCLIRVPASPDAYVLSWPDSPGIAAHIRGINNSGTNIGNYSEYVSYPITLLKWPIGNVNITYLSTTSDYLTNMGSMTAVDQRPKALMPTNSLADNSRGSLDFVMGSTAAGVTNTASGWIRTLYFTSKQIDL